MQLATSSHGEYSAPRSMEGKLLSAPWTRSGWPQGSNGMQTPPGEVLLTPSLVLAARPMIPPGRVRPKILPSDGACLFTFQSTTVGCTKTRPARARADTEMRIIYRWHNYLGFPPAGSGRGWCTLLSVLSQKGTHNIPVVSTHGETVNQASATLCNIWRGEAPCGETPAAAHPRNVGSWRIYWADPGSSEPSPVLPWLLSSSLTSSPRNQQLFLPTFLLHLLVSSPAAFSLQGWWRRTRSW